MKNKKNHFLKKETVEQYSKKISKYSKLFLYSYWSIVSIFVFIALTTGLSTLLTWSTDTQSNSQIIIASFLIVIAFASGIFGLLGDLMLHRNRMLCFVFYFLFIFIYLINVIYNNLWYETITQIAMLFIVGYAFINWSKEEKHKKITVISWKSFWIVIFYILIISAFLGAIMTLINSSEWITENKKDPYPYLDAFISVTFFGGWLLMSRKIFQAYIVYVMCTIATLILCIIFIIAGDYYYLIYGATNIFYLIFYFIGSNNWSSIFKKQEEKEKSNI